MIRAGLLWSGGQHSSISNFFHTNHVRSTFVSLLRPDYPSGLSPPSHQIHFPPQPPLFFFKSLNLLSAHPNYNRCLQLVCICTCTHTHTVFAASRGRCWFTFIKKKKTSHHRSSRSLHWNEVKGPSRHANTGGLTSAAGQMFHPLCPFRPLARLFNIQRLSVGDF